MSWTLTLPQLCLMLFPFLLLVIGSKIQSGGINILAGMLLFFIPLWLGAPWWLAVICIFFGMGIIFGNMVRL